MNTTPDNSTVQRLNPREYLPALKAVISVTGAASRAGKTTLVEALVPLLLRRGHQVTALKVTRSHTGECPRMHPTCTTCNDLTAPFELVTESERIKVSGKDTGRYHAAGAQQVLWLQAQPADLREGLCHALSHITPGHVLVGEGNSFRENAEADLTLMALGSQIRLKPSANKVVEHTTAWACFPEDLNMAKTWLNESKKDQNKVFSTENWQWLIPLLASIDL